VTKGTGSGLSSRGNNHWYGVDIQWSQLRPSDYLYLGCLQGGWHQGMQPRFSGDRHPDRHAGRFSALQHVI
jgi:hypothetical protein